MLDLYFSKKSTPLLHGHIVGNIKKNANSVTSISISPSVMLILFFGSQYEAPMLYPPLWFFLFCHRFKLSLLVRWRELCACTCWKHCRLYKLLHFAYVLVFSWNFRVHRISRPPCRKSAKYFLLPVTLHKIVPFFLRNNEQIADIFLGTWPTVVSSFTIATTKELTVLNGSRQVTRFCSKSSAVVKHQRMFVVLKTASNVKRLF